MSTFLCALLAYTSHYYKLCQTISIQKFMLKLTYVGVKKVYTIEKTNGIIYTLALFHSFNGICGTVLVSSFVPPDMSYTIIPHFGWPSRKNVLGPTKKWIKFSRYFFSVSVVFSIYINIIPIWNFSGLLRSQIYLIFNNL